jgi:hypothetical protein
VRRPANGAGSRNPRHSYWQYRFLGGLAAAPFGHRSDSAADMRPKAAVLIPTRRFTAAVVSARLAAFSLPGSTDHDEVSSNDSAFFAACTDRERGYLPRQQKGTMPGIALVDAELARHKRQGLGRQAPCLPLSARSTGIMRHARMSVSLVTRVPKFPPIVMVSGGWRYRIGEARRAV